MANASSVKHIVNAFGGAKHSGSVVASNNGVNVIYCDICNYCHQLPLPEGTEEYYKDDKFYREHSPIGWLQKELQEYRSGAWDVAYQWQASMLYAALPVIDVGASTGTFVDWWRSNYMSSAFGIEPSASARSIALRKNSIFESLDAMKDVVHFDQWSSANVRMSLVLEHIPNAAEFLDTYATVMGKYGTMQIIVPNEFNPLQKRAGGDWFLSKVHANYFNEEGLRLLLGRVGLKITRVTSTFPIEMAIMVGLDYRKNPKLGSKIHLSRLAFERTFKQRSFALYEKLYRKWGWGRELIVMAEWK